MHVGCRPPHCICHFVQCKYGDTVCWSDTIGQAIYRQKGTLEDAVSVGDFDSKMTHSRPIHRCLTNRRDLFRLFTRAFTLFTKATPSMYNLISEATYFTNVLSSIQGLGFRLET